MYKTYHSIKEFLENTKNVDYFIESDAIIWIDWREYDEDIITYVNKQIEEKVEVELICNHKPYGDNICLKYNREIPYYPL